MAFESWENIESILTAVFTGLVSLIGAIGLYIKNTNWKSWKSILKSVHSKDFKSVVEIAKKEVEIIEKMVEEKLNPKKESEENKIKSELK